MSATTNARHRRGGQATGGVAGNERLTAMTGAVLLVLFAAEGVTILRIGRLLTLHLLLAAALACGLLLAAATVHLAARWGAIAPVDGRAQGVISTVRDSV